MRGGEEAGDLAPKGVIRNPTRKGRDPKAPPAPQGAPTYGARDIEILGLFANQAAVAIEQSRAQGSVAALLEGALRTSGAAEGSPDERAGDFLAGVEEDVSHRRALELARLVGEISRRGEQESAACLTILHGFADYLRSRPEDREDLMEDFG